jgi:hypothetical protein
MDFQDVTNYCKLHYGIGILKAHDPDFCDWYDSLIKSTWTYEQKLIFMENFDVTSRFNTEQATEYINLIIEREGRNGINFAEAALRDAV